MKKLRRIACIIGLISSIILANLSLYKALIDSDYYLLKISGIFTIIAVLLSIYFAIFEIKYK